MSETHILHPDEAIVEDSEDIVPGSSQERKCPWCPKLFREGSSLKKHLGSCHATHVDNPNSKKKEGSGRLLCPKRGCGEMLISYDYLCRHCADEHGFVPNHENYRFDSSDEFKTWLTHLASTSGEMVKRRGERTTSDGTTVGDFHCIFDGKKRETPSTRAPDRNPYNRRVPSKKLGFACPAFIRFQIQPEGCVQVRAQIQHFGHDIKPRDMGHVTSKLARHSVMGRRKEKRSGYAFEGLNYDEVHSQHFNQPVVIDEERVEVDEQGMVSLYSSPSLDQAKFYALSSFANLEMSFAEVQSIPQENYPYVGHLIEKLHEIADAAHRIESMVKELASVPPHSSLKRKINKIPELNQKRLLRMTMKEEVGNGEKRPLEVENGSHEEESFDRLSESGEIEYEGDVAEEVVVDVVDDSAEEMPRRNEERNKKIGKKNLI